MSAYSFEFVLAEFSMNFREEYGNASGFLAAGIF